MRGINPDCVLLVSRILQSSGLIDFTFVRSYVRPTLSQKSTHQIFLIFLMKPWFHKCKKVTVSLFHRKFKIGPFLAKKCQKLVIFGQNSLKSLFVVLILKVTHQIFLIFLMKPWLYKCKKITVSLFCQKFKIGPFLPKNS